MSRHDRRAPRGTQRVVLPMVRLIETSLRGRTEISTVFSVQIQPGIGGPKSIRIIDMKLGFDVRCRDGNSNGQILHVCLRDVSAHRERIKQIVLDLAESEGWEVFSD